MKSFLRAFSGLGIITLYISLLLATTLVVQFLNPDFLITNLKKPGVYDHIEDALKIGARESLRNSLKKEGIDIESLTTGQRAKIENQIDTLLNPITKANIQEFSETNIRNFLNFINGKSDQLIIYLPLKKWGVIDGEASDVPKFTKSENLDVLKLIDEGNLNIPKNTIISLKNIGSKIRLWWIVTIILLIISTFAHYTLGGKERKLENTLSFYFYGGIISLLGAWILNVIVKTFGEGLEIKRKPMEILLGTLVPSILSETIKLWLTFGITTILLAFFISYAANNLARNKTAKNPV